jgi:hypothetical protein
MSSVGSVGSLWLENRPLPCWQVLLDLNLRWIGDQNIVLYIRTSPSLGLTTKVKDFDFASTVRVIFKKLVPQFPCFSTLEVT